MFTGQVKVRDIGLIDAYRELFDQIPDLVQTAVDREAAKIEAPLLIELRTEPGPVKYPILWTSERQRKAFFATNGFGRGIGAKRTHTLSQGWKLKISRAAREITEVSVTNPTDYLQFVTGENQQVFHSITGWHDDAVIINTYQRQLSDNVESALIRLLYAVEG